MSSEDALAVESDSETQGEKTQSERSKRVVEYEEEQSEDASRVDKITESTTSSITEKTKSSGPKQSKAAEQKSIEAEIVSRIDLPSKSAASGAVQKETRRDMSPQKGRHTTASPAQTPDARQTRSASRSAVRRKVQKEPQ